MRVTRELLEDAVTKNIISSTQADALHEFLLRQPGTGPGFDFTHVLYYLGGLVAIGAMTLFMNLGWESFGGWGIFFIALLYAGVGLNLTGQFQRRGYAIPAGICATFVVALTPLAVYGLQQALDFWPDDDSTYQAYHRYITWNWFYMELATLAVGVITAWRYRYPFLVMPLAVTLWYLSMDIAALILGDHVSFELQALVSMHFGFLMLVLAVWVDFRASGKADYAFWLYLFGMMAFWGGMTSQDSDSEFSKFLYLCINLLLIVIGMVLVRRVFVVFGALGTCAYLGHLAFDVFEGSWLFPITLTAIGFMIIYLGVLWQRHEQDLTILVRGWLPGGIRSFLESRPRQK